MNNVINLSDRRAARVPSVARAKSGELVPLRVAVTAGRLKNFVGKAAAKALAIELERPKLSNIGKFAALMRRTGLPPASARDVLAEVGHVAHERRDRCAHPKCSKPESGKHRVHAHTYCSANCAEKDGPRRRRDDRRTQKAAE